MLYAVTIDELGATVSLTDRPESSPWDIQEDVVLDIPLNYADWPEGAERPRPLLCRSRKEPHHYTVFQDRRDINPDEFEPTGTYFGGLFSRSSWERFVPELPKTLAGRMIEATEAPGATDQALQALQGGA